MDSRLRGNDGETHSFESHPLSLIKVMIVVAIMGVLAAIAYPSFQESIAKGRRAKATSQLAAAQQWMERFDAENLSYNQTTTAPPIRVTHASQFPSRLSTVPPSGQGPAFYNPAVAAKAGTFIITAKRVGAMSAVRCGDLTLDHHSRKSFVASSDSGFADVSAARAYSWR